MPKPQIIDTYRESEHKAHEEFKAAGIPIPDAKNLIPFISNEVARVFEVSSIAAEIRLKNVLIN